jgi:hypothetical protein
VLDFSWTVFLNCNISFQLILGFSFSNHGMPSTTLFFLVLSGSGMSFLVVHLVRGIRQWLLLYFRVFILPYALVLPFHVVTFLIPFCKHHSLLSLSTNIVAFICFGLIHRRKIFRILATLPASPQIFLCCILNFIS